MKKILLIIMLISSKIHSMQVEDNINILNALAPEINFYIFFKDFEYINKIDNLYDFYKINFQKLKKIRLTCRYLNELSKNLILKIKDKRKELINQCNQKYKNFDKKKLDLELKDKLNKKELKECLELIAMGADINTTDKYGSTLLMKLIPENNIKNLIKNLIKNKADIHLKNEYGENALIISCQLGKKDIANLLIKNKVDINDSTNSQTTSLMRAVRHNRIDLVIFLLENKNLNIDQKNYFGDTALTEAILNQNFDIAKILLNKKADINSQNKNLDSILIQAIKLKKIKAIKFLIKNKADINLKNKYGETPLNLIRFSLYPEIQKIQKLL